MSLSSDDEKVLFTRWGWVYDYIARKWVAPNGAEVSTDDLMGQASPEAEERLVAFVQEHGQLTE